MFARLSINYSLLSFRMKTSESDGVHLYQRNGLCNDTHFACYIYIKKKEKIWKKKKKNKKKKKMKKKKNYFLNLTFKHHS